MLNSNKNLQKFAESWTSANLLLEAEDWDNAFISFKRLAAEGCTPALFMLGLIREKANDFRADKQEALYWYNKSVDELDDVESHFSLARIYLSEDVNDHEKALYHLRLLESLDKAGVYFGLGVIFDAGIAVDRSAIKALNYFDKASRKGHLVAKILFEGLSGKASTLRLWKLYLKVFILKKLDPNDPRIILDLSL